MNGVMVIVGAAVGLIVFVVMIVAFAQFAAKRATLAASRDPAAAGATLVVPALMRGGRSPSGHELNGNGALAVFPTEIRFILGVPRRAMTIRRAHIANVAVTKNLRLPGKRSAGGPPYLTVQWADSDGSHTTAFQTTSADSLLALLHEGPDTTGT